MRFFAVLSICFICFINRATAQTPCFWGVNFYQDDIARLKQLAVRRGAKPVVPKEREPKWLEFIGRFDNNRNVLLRFYVLWQNVRDKKSASTFIYAGYAIFERLTRPAAARLVDVYTAKLSAKYHEPNFRLDTLRRHTDGVVIYRWRKVSDLTFPSIVRYIYDEPDGGDRRKISIGCHNNRIFELPSATSAADSMLGATTCEY